MGREYSLNLLASLGSEDAQRINIEHILRPTGHLFQAYQVPDGCDFDWHAMPCFLDDVDRIHYLELLGEALLVTDVRLHAYVLMDNHVHLLVTPPEIGAVGRMMQMLGRNVVRQFNTRHGRTGTLWEGR